MSNHMMNQRINQSTSPYELENLNDIDLDPQLVRKLPRKFAYYHLILPLALENDQMSVAVASIENSAIFDMVSAIFHATIIPIRANANEIRRLLDQVWQNVPKPDPHILVWSRLASYNDIAYENAKAFATIFDAQITDCRTKTLDEIILISQQDQYALTVISTDTGDNAEVYVREIGTPVLLCYGQIVPSFTRLLLSLRGHAPDLSALDWVIPLTKTYQANVTILAVTSPRRENKGYYLRGTHSLTTLLDPAQQPAQHLKACTQRLVDVDIHGYLKLCQGNPAEQIIAEFVSGQYNLLLLVSETYGDFAVYTLDQLRQTLQQYAVLVVKPQIAHA